jgi:hypothetical protein
MPSFFAVSPAKPIVLFESRFCAFLTRIFGERYLVGPRREKPRDAKGDGEVDLLALQRGA